MSQQTRDVGTARRCQPVGVLVDVKLGTASSQGGSTPGYALKVQISTEKKEKH